MEKENKVLDTLGKVLEARLSNDKAELDALLGDVSNDTVSLSDVVVALDVILDDVTDLVDHDFELTEYRLRAIVESLDEVTQARIKTKFAEAEDTLFEGEK